MAYVLCLQLGLALFTAAGVMLAAFWHRSREAALRKQIGEVLEAVTGLRSSLEAIGSLRDELVAAGALQRSAHLPPPPPPGLPRRAVAVTRDDDPAHARPTTEIPPPASQGERPASPPVNPARVPSLDDQIEARYLVLLEQAGDRGEPASHCAGSDCWEGPLGLCTCRCAGCDRATALLTQATREVAGERVTPA